MGDLILGIGMIATGAAGMIAAGVAYHKMPEWNARMDRLRKRSDVQLHAELTRCVGAIAECARRGDRKGLRHARRAMKPIMRVMSERSRMHAKRKTARVAA